MYSRHSNFTNVVNSGIAALDMSPPRATFPRKHNFPVTILGIDNQSNAYIHLNNVDDWKIYVKHMMEVKQECDMHGKIVPFEKLEEGIFVIAKVANNKTPFYVRAKIVGKSESNRTITCMNLDEREEFRVPKEQIFYPTNHAMKIPLRAIKCMVSGLEFFYKMDDIQIAFKQSKINSAFLATCRPKNTRLPCLELITPQGENLADIIMKELPSISGVVVPDLEKPTPVLVTHIDEDGYFWFQDENDEFILRMEVHQLTGFITPDRSAYMNARNRLNDESALFLAPFADGGYYRAKILHFIDIERVLVDFIDYGNDEIMKITDLIIVQSKILSCIPPRAKMVKLSNTHCVDLSRARKLFANSVSNEIYVLKHDETTQNTEADILLKDEDGNLHSFIDLLNEEYLSDCTFGMGGFRFEV